MFKSMLQKRPPSSGNQRIEVQRKPNQPIGLQMIIHLPFLLVCYNHADARNYSTTRRDVSEKASILRCWDALLARQMRLGKTKHPDSNEPGKLDSLAPIW